MTIDDVFERIENGDYCEQPINHNRHANVDYFKWTFRGTAQEYEAGLEAAKKEDEAAYKQYLTNKIRERQRLHEMFKSDLETACGMTYFSKKNEVFNLVDHDLIFTDEFVNQYYYITQLILAYHREQTF